HLRMEREHRLFTAGSPLAPIDARAGTASRTARDGTHSRAVDPRRSLPRTDHRQPAAPFFECLRRRAAHSVGPGRDPLAQTVRATRPGHSGLIAIRAADP